MMKTIYKAHILFTKEQTRFEVVENGYIAVEDGLVAGVAGSLSELKTECPTFNVDEVEVVDFGDKLLIPAMNDMHVHAPQVHNQGVAMDLELLPWLQNYTFPEESKYADVQYAERMYRRFLHTQWLFGTMRSVVFGTVHTESTRLLMKLYQEAGMGALVGKVKQQGGSKFFALHSSLFTFSPRPSYHHAALRTVVYAGVVAGLR